MNQNYPNPEPAVVTAHELRVTRRFPAETDVVARVGERVGADRVIGKIEPRLVATRVPVAAEVGGEPAEVGKHLVVSEPGAQVKAGEPLARTRRGMRSVVVASPVTGTFVEVDRVSGSVLVAPAGASEVRTLLPGDIEEVDGKRSVTLRTVGSRVTGIVGIGPAVAGTLRVVTRDARQPLTPDLVPTDIAGAIVVCGGPVDAAALGHLVASGVAGLVTGGLIEREIGAAFGWQVEDRLAPWRPQPGDRGLAEGLPVPLAMMATEGFGALAMHPAAFDLLASLDGRRATLLPTTRIIGELIRPELIVPEPDLLDEDADTTRATLSTGARVRLVDHANLGRSGTVASPPRRAAFPDGNHADGLDVTLDDGSTLLARIVNVEVVALGE